MLSAKTWYMRSLSKTRVLSRFVQINLGVVKENGPGSADGSGTGTNRLILATKKANHVGKVKKNFPQRNTCLTLFVWPCLQVNQILRPSSVCPTVVEKQREGYVLSRKSSEIIAAMGIVFSSLIRGHS